MGERNFENIFSTEAGGSLSAEDIAAIDEAIKLSEANENSDEPVVFEQGEKFSGDNLIPFESLTSKEQTIINKVKEAIIISEELAGRSVEDYQRMSEFLHRKYFSNAVFMQNKLDSWRRNSEVSIENAADNLYKLISEEAVAILAKEFPKYN
ncbi:MAG: hypothetical protein WAV16_02540 [Candidatus Moraniibacteriota bacterium]